MMTGIRTGRCTPQAFYQRDPLSPPFHVNLLWGLRFLQASLLVPLHRRAPRHTRAIPIRFEEVSRVKKPSRRAEPLLWQQYRQAVKQHNLSQRFVQMMHDLRLALDAAGGAAKTLVLAGDGSFCNRTCLRAVEGRTALIVRTRKDAALCGRAADGSRRFYDPAPWSRSARMRGTRGRRRRCVTGASGARFGTKNAPTSIGETGPADGRSGSSSSRPRRTRNARVAGATTGNLPIC